MYIVLLYKCNILEYSAVYNTAQSLNSCWYVLMTLFCSVKNTRFYYKTNFVWKTACGVKTAIVGLQNLSLFLRGISSKKVLRLRKSLPCRYMLMKNGFSKAPTRLWAVQYSAESGLSSFEPKYLLKRKICCKTVFLQTVADVGSIFEKYITVTEEYISLVEQTATPDRLTKSPLTQPLPVRSVQKGR